MTKYNWEKCKAHEYYHKAEEPCCYCEAERSSTLDELVTEALRNSVNKHNDRINKTRYDVCKPCGRIYVIDIGCPGCAKDSKIAPMEESARDKQVGGSHYADMPIQPAEYAHANKIGELEFLCLRYISRHRKKNGRQDVEKAIHVLELLLDLEYPE